MQIVINMPEKYYNNICNSETVSNYSVLYALNGIRNGTPIQTCEDAVSRQAVIDCKYAISDDEIGERKYVVDVTDIVELPPVTPMQKWIPVSERLPDKEGQYLVTFQSSNFGVSSMEIANFSLDLSNASFLFRHEKSRSGWWGRDDGGWNTFIYSGVIAWMPLPQSYEPQENKTKQDLSYADQDTLMSAT